MKNVNGVLVDESPEDLAYAAAEREKWESESSVPEVSPSLDERVTVLEQDMADIQTAYQEGVNNA